MPRAKAQPRSTTKIRGQTCTRMQKLRISNGFTGENVKSDNNLNTYLSNITTPTKFTSPHVNDCNSPTKVGHKNCDNCQESGNCMKILVERLSRIEEIVSNLAKLTKEFNAESRNKIVLNNTPLSQDNMFHGVNLSTCKLEELQKFVILATDTMTPNLKRKFTDEPEKGLNPFSSNLNSATTNNSSSINRHNIMNTDVDPKKIELRNLTSPLNSENEKVGQSYSIKQEKQDSWYSSSEKPLVNKRKRSLLAH